MFGGGVKNENPQQDKLVEGFPAPRHAAPGRVLPSPAAPSPAKPCPDRKAYNMTLSAAMQARYTSEVDVDFWDALIISHPAAGTSYLTNAQSPQRGTFNGGTRTFVPIPFEVTLPTLDGEGQQDLQVVICNIGEEMYEALDKIKQQPEQPIVCEFTQYIEGDLAPQFDPPFHLHLSDIELTREVFRGTATRSDIFNQRFPRQLYRGDMFPALVRR